MMLEKDKHAAMQKKRTTLDSVLTEKALQQLLANCERDARAAYLAHAEKLQVSRVNAHFPHLLSPSYQGCLVEMHDTALRDDSAYIEYDKNLILYDDSQRQTVYCAAADTIYPFRVESPVLERKRVVLPFVPHGKSFKFTQAQFSFWALGHHSNQAQSLQFFNTTLHADSVKLELETAKGVDIVNASLQQSEKYICHFNQRMLMKMSDANWYHYIDVKLDKLPTTPIKQMKLIIDDIAFSKIKNIDITDCFYTNLFAFKNQIQTSIVPFTMDGTRDIYWLQVKDIDDYNILEVIHLKVEEDHTLIPFKDYQVIYESDKVGIQFNNISEVLDKSVTGQVNIATAFNRSANPHNVSAKWFSSTKLSQEFKVVRYMEHCQAKLNVELLRHVMVLLKLNQLRTWTLIEWCSLFAFFDSLLTIDIANYLRDVVLEQQHVTLYFYVDTEEMCTKVRFMAELILQFVAHHTRYLELQLSAEVNA